MAETKNVYILRDVSADKVRTGKAEIELRNGDIVAIGTKADGVYTLTAPTADFVIATLYLHVYHAIYTK